MDWITFIKWNGIVYATYYGANLLVDYMRIRKEHAPQSPVTEYHLQHFGAEPPQTIRSEDFLHVRKEQDDGGATSKPKGNNKGAGKNNITFQAPIERQGIPLSEFLKTAHQYTTKIYQPTI